MTRFYFKVTQLQQIIDIIHLFFRNMLNNGYVSAQMFFGIFKVFVFHRQHAELLGKNGIGVRVLRFAAVVFFYQIQQVICDILVVKPVIQIESLYPEGVFYAFRVTVESLIIYVVFEK